MNERDEFSDRRLADEYLFEMSDEQLKELARSLNISYQKLKLRADLAKQRILEEEDSDTGEYPVTQP
jgi:hypothetical protein